jgi:alpha-tubulin suppressor-like RCC1 family protein
MNRLTQLISTFALGLVMTACQNPINPPPTEDFTLLLVPASLTIAAGASDQTIVAIAPKNGFITDIDLTLEGNAVGGGANQVDGAFIANTAISASLTLTVGANVMAGTYNLTVRGTSGSLNHTAPLALTVTSIGTQQPPHIASLPALSARGVVTTIMGSDFGATQGGSSVSFGGVNATQVKTWSDTQITVIVPSTVPVGSAVNVVVTTSGGTNQMATRVIKPVTIAAGLTHSLALTPDGGVVGWGANNKAQITIPSSAQSGIVSIAGNQAFGLALSSNGGVIGWGDNGNGQTTIPASASSDVIAISAGDGHALALKTNGSVIAWGYNINKQATVPAGAQSGVVAISAGGQYSLALKTDGSVLAWGYMQGYPLPASASSNVASLESGTAHALAIKTDGSVVGWGDPTSGRIAIPAEASSGVAAISAGFDHSLILKDDGSLLAIGGNASGQTTIPSAALTGVAAIAAGNRFNLAIKTDGSVVAWGANDQTQINVPSGLIAAIP